jgi:hypothetical protein
VRSDTTAGLKRIGWPRALRTLGADDRAGAFLAGTASPATAGVRIAVQFNRAGRYLVVCMNRAHLINDHMFGFVNVVGDDDDQG